jgi:hypothetical protein
MAILDAVRRARNHEGARAHISPAERNLVILTNPINYL